MSNVKRPLVPECMQKKTRIVLDITATVSLIRGLLYFLSNRDYEFVILNKETGEPECSKTVL